MARMVTNPLLRHIRRIATVELPQPLADSQLLARFVRHRDEKAFAALMERYGPMVWGVCRRVLGQWHAAEDAYQAVFLVLARKASSLSRGELVGHWLYRVAYRIAVRARMDAARRQARERQAAPKPVLEAFGAVEVQDLRGMLDEAVQRLPEKYRLPVVLCYLQGKTNAQAASVLGCPQGTVVTRLARARQWLRAYLGRRGFAGSLAVAVTALSQRQALPAGLNAAAARNLTALMAGSQASAAMAASVQVLVKGALKSMWITKLKTVVAAMVLIGMAFTGGGLAAYQVLAAQDPAPSTPRPEPEAKAPETPRGPSFPFHPAPDDGSCRFTVPITPIFEGGARGQPTLFEVGIKCQRPEFLLSDEDELPDQVRNGLVTALQRLKSKEPGKTGAVKLRFGVTITPWFEGEAVGEPILYTIEVSGQAQEALEAYEQELPDRVKAGLVKTLRRLKAKQAAATNPRLEQVLDKLLDRLDAVEKRVHELEERRRSGSGAGQ